MGKYEDLVKESEAKQKAKHAEAAEAGRKKALVEQDQIARVQKTMESIVRPELDEAKTALSKHGHETKVSDKKIILANYNTTYTSLLHIEATTTARSKASLEFDVTAVGANIHVKMRDSTRGVILEEDVVTTALTQPTVEKYTRDFISWIFNLQRQ